MNKIIYNVDRSGPKDKTSVLEGQGYKHAEPIYPHRAPQEELYRLQAAQSSVIAPLQE